MSADAPRLVITEIATLGAILDAHADALGGDFAGYWNHTHRIANLCAAHAAPGAEVVEKIAIAAAFHDLAIWTHGTFDYLKPSIGLAENHLASIGMPRWQPDLLAPQADTLSRGT
ncbi:hypothetical protein [Aminobacter sp. AP02]|uniref:hypothetical protein n=1 Tax=Aminobacter sp. AP02 TaxID=2135737 RepID=UPI000D6C0B98|nr:hypothetical protein [Aminobacter sp. AP02]PWK61752.1 hypothetical protein C8K44_13224 [Aminobacter sp. AP02]